MLWQDVIEDYNGREITFPEDRKPALAGVASELHKIWKDAYLAGVWRTFLVRHLVWHFLYRKERGHTEPEYAASYAVYEGPSWSWISCPHKVAIDGGGDLHEHAELLDCSVTLKTDTAQCSLFSSA
jgi:hypothetical protein